MKRLGLTGLLLAVVFGMATDANAQAVAKGKNELSLDANVVTAKETGEGDHERITASELGGAYARFVTDRLAVGPVVTMAKASGSGATASLGGLARYYLGDLTKRAIPVVEINSTRSLNDPLSNYTDLQVSAGLMIPMGSTGGRLRIAPYYYRAFYDEAVTGYSSYQSFGISWRVALLF